jgi:general secretion pathway protein K
MTSARAQSDRANSQRGSALLVVLLMFGMISALAAILSRSVSSAAMELSVSRLSLQSGSDLRGGLELAAATAAKLGKDMRSADATVMLPDRRISIRMVNERGRIDLNAASRELLTGLFTNSGVLEDEADVLTRAVLDWRGGSASQKLVANGDDRGFGGFSGFGSGARPSEDMRQAPQRIVGTRYFHHPMQLLAVPGFSKALVARLLPNVTVVSASGRVDPFIAPNGVLAALPGSSPEKADQFREVKNSNTSRATAVQILGVPKEAVTTDAAPGWRVFITSTLRNGQTFRNEAIIAIIKGDSEPYRVVYVVD